jgi:hypothetical protein
MKKKYFHKQKNLQLNHKQVQVSTHLNKTSLRVKKDSSIQRLVMDRKKNKREELRMTRTKMPFQSQ